MSYRRFFDPAQVESDQKDLVISQLKADLFELRNSVRDYNDINSQLNLLEHKYAILQEEKLRAEQQRRYKQESDAKNLINLQDDVQALRNDSRNQNIDIQELRADNSALQDMADFRTQEQQKLRSEITDIETKNRYLTEANINATSNIRALKEQKRTLGNEAEILANSNDQLNGKNRNVERAIKELQLENNKLDKQLSHMQKNNDILNMEIRNQNDSINNANHRLNENERELQNNQNELYSLERQAEKLKEESIQNQINFQNENNRGQDLGMKLTNIETTIRSQELHLDDLRGNYELLKNKHFDLLDENQYLNNEIDRALYQIQQLNLVNKQLSEEFEFINEQDEVARTILNRRDVIQNATIHNHSRVKGSLASILHLSKADD